MSVAAALSAAVPLGSVAPQNLDRSFFEEALDVSALTPRQRARILASDDDLERMRSYRFVAGHFPLPTLERIAPPEEIVTLLREPRARLLSQYAYWRHHLAALQEEWHAPPARRPGRQPLAVSLAEPLVAGETDNVVTRYVMQGDPRVPREAFIDPADGPSLAQEVIERLARLRHVAILERQGDLFEELSTALGVPLRAARVNVTGKGENVAPADAPDADADSPEALRLVEDRTAVDRIVYEHFAAKWLEDRTRARKMADDAYAQQRERLRAVEGRRGGSGAASVPVAASDAFPDEEDFERDTEFVMKQREIALLTARSIWLQGELEKRDAVIDRMQIQERLAARGG